MIIAELFSRLGIQVDKGGFESGTKMIDGLRGALGALGLAFGIHEVGELIKGVTDLAVKSEETAKTLGVTVESVQELGYAAKVSGVSSEELEVSLFHLSRGLQELAKGEGPASDAFHKLGISAKDFKGETLDQNLEVLATKFQKLPDGPNKVALAMDIFGRSGARLIPFLDRGQAGIVALRNEAESLGIVIGGKTAESFKELERDQARLSGVWEGIKIQIVEALLPGLKDLAESTLKWVSANKEIISSTLGYVVQGFVLVVKGLGIAFEAVVETIQFFSDHTEALVGVLAIVGAAFGAWAIEMAVNWLLALGPADLLLIAFGLLAAGITYVVKHWSKFAPAVQMVKDKIAAFGEWVISIPNKIAHVFSEAWEQIKEDAKAAFEWIVNLPVIKQLIGIAKIISNPKGAAGGVVDSIKGIFQPSKKSDDASTSKKSGELTDVNGDMKPRELPAGATGVASFSRDNDVGRALDLATANPAVPSIADMLRTINAPQAPAPSYDVSFGDVHLDITAPPGIDATQLSRMITDQVKDSQNEMLKNTYETLRGGRQ